MGSPRLPALPDASVRMILIDAIRCWRLARDGGEPVQPSLSRTLKNLKSAILVPTLDSLLKFYELALGRRIAVSGNSHLSDDESMLLALMIGSKSRGFSRLGGEAVAAQFQDAIRSARIMLGLAMAEDGIELRAG